METLPFQKKKREQEQKYSFPKDSTESKSSLKIGLINKVGCFDIETSSLLAYRIYFLGIKLCQDRQLKFSASVSFK